MNTKSSRKKNASVTPTNGNKKRRRHTRIQLDSLKPILANVQDGSCPKCKGRVRTEAGECLSQTVIRCLNCGWQPQYQAPIIRESEEARMWRALSVQFVSECDWYRLPVGF